MYEWPYRRLANPNTNPVLVSAILQSSRIRITKIRKIRIRISSVEITESFQATK